MINYKKKIYDHIALKFDFEVAYFIIPEGTHIFFWTHLLKLGCGLFLWGVLLDLKNI